MKVFLCDRLKVVASDLGSCLFGWFLCWGFGVI